MNDKSFLRALATAFFITLGIMAWLAAIASIICSCASHKERSEVHKADSVSVVQEKKQSNILTEITSNSNYSFDSIVFNETVVSGDSGRTETAHRTFVIRGFHATNITSTTNKVDSSSSKNVMIESHKRDSTEQSSQTTAVAKPLTKFSDYLTIGFVIIFFSLLYVFLYRKRSTNSLK